MSEEKTILVTGATGYIGGRLVPNLLGAGYQVRVLSRDPARLRGRSWEEDVDIVQADVLKPETLPEVLEKVNAAYYLIHNMSRTHDFHQRDINAARNFGQAAHKAGVGRIIYLGGLGDPESDLSEHLKSRQATGRALAEAGVPVTEFRAGVIIGCGSISFEMIRNLTERIPLMVCPRWVYTKAQPISTYDVLSYLTTALSVPESTGHVIEIGGSDVVSFAEMIKDYARKRDLKRIMIPFPFITPRLSSFWIHWMTPVPATISRPLIEGLRNEVIVQDDIAKELFPEIQPVGYFTAFDRSLKRLSLGNIESRWTDSMISSMGDIVPVQLKTEEGMVFDRRQEVVNAPPEVIFKAITSLGGDKGWLYANWAWEIRGLMDRLIGGVGLRRGRRDPEVVRFGDAIDFWRVEVVKTNQLLRLRAEMIVPGKAWLEFETQPEQDGVGSTLNQTAYFAPKGLFGLVYWYSLLPIHSLIFAGMIRRIKELAEEPINQGT